MNRACFHPILLSLILLGCGGPQTPEPKLVAKPLDRPGVIVKPAAEVKPPTAMVGGDILATISASSLDAFLRVGAGYLAPHLPPAFQPMVQPDTLRAQLFKTIHIDGLEAALDSSRPFAVAIADPMVYRGRGELGSALFAIPVKDGSELVSVFARRSDKHETTPWRDHVFSSSSGRAVYLRLAKDWALLASHEKLLHGAAAELLPLTASARGTAGVRLEVRMGLIGERYSEQIDKGLARLRRNKPGQGAFGMVGIAKRIERWLGLARGMQVVHATLELEPGGAQAKLSATAKPSGPFRSYLASLASGEPWGAKFLPKGSALYLLSRENEATRLSEMNDALDLLGVLLRDAGEEKLIGALREGLTSIARQLGSESAAALWVNGNGGVGMGGAVKVKDPKAAQAEMSKLFGRLAKDLKRIVDKALWAKTERALAGADPAQRKKLEAAARRELPGLTLKVKRGGAKLAGVTIDLYELGVVWPQLKGAEEKKKLAEIKKKVDKVIGLPFTIGFGATGEVGVMAMGKDWRKRLGELCAAAKGGPGSVAVEKNLAAVAGGKPIVMLIQADLTSIVESSMRVADQLTAVPSDLRDQVNKLLPGKEVPVSTLIYREGDAFTVELRAPAEVFGMLTKAGMALFMARAGGSVAPVPVP
jgi:hypothetical protein